eukprot:gene4127-22036_t
MRCYWGTTPDKAKILSAKRRLFAGWTDGNNNTDNLIICEDPAPGTKALHFVLQHAGGQGGRTLIPA